MELAELKSAVDAYAGDTKKALDALEAKLAAETKDREALELQLQRNGLGAGKKANDPSVEHKAIGKFVRTGDDTELKTMSVNSDPDGGYLVLPVMGDSLIQKIREQSAIARLARRITISTGDAWEEIVDFDETGATWVGETQARPATSTPRLGKIRIPVEEIYAAPKVTQRLLDDSAFNVGGWIEDKIADKFGRTEGAAFVTGTGVGQPKGFLTENVVSTSDATRAFGDIQYIPTGHASSFASSSPGDALIDMVYKLRAPYKQGGNVAWVMNSTTAAATRKLKDGQGNYLWQQSVQAGQPDTLLGYPVELDEFMDDLGANKFPIALANWQKAYTIVDKAGIRMLRDPFTDKPHVIFYAYRRVGGGLSNSECIKLLKCATS